jgi:hypothetical protein
MLDHASLAVGGRSPRCFLALRLRTSLASFSAEYKAPSPMQSQAKTLTRVDISPSSRPYPRAQIFFGEVYPLPGLEGNRGLVSLFLSKSRVLSPGHDLPRNGIELAGPTVNAAPQPG